MAAETSTCYTLHSKNKSVGPAIIFRFTNKKNKHAIVRQGRKLEGSDVYINEHLTTKKNTDIARKACVNFQLLNILTSSETSTSWKEDP